MNALGRPILIPGADRLRPFGERAAGGGLIAQSPEDDPVASRLLVPPGESARRRPPRRELSLRLAREALAAERTISPRRVPGDLDHRNILEPRTHDNRFVRPQSRGRCTAWPCRGGERCRSRRTRNEAASCRGRGEPENALLLNQAASSRFVVSFTSSAKGDTRAACSGCSRSRVLERQSFPSCLHSADSSSLERPIVKAPPAKRTIDESFTGGRGGRRARQAKTAKGATAARASSEATRRAGRTRVERDSRAERASGCSVALGSVGRNASGDETFRDRSGSSSPVPAATTSGRGTPPNRGTSGSSVSPAPPSPSPAAAATSIAGGRCSAPEETSSPYISRKQLSTAVPIARADGHRSDGDRASAQSTIRARGPGAPATAPSDRAGRVAV